MFPSWFTCFGGSFVSLAIGPSILFFVFPLFLGCFGLFMIGRVSSPCQCRMLMMVEALFFLVLKRKREYFEGPLQPRFFFFFFPFLFFGDNFVISKTLMIFHNFLTTFFINNILKAKISPFFFKRICTHIAKISHLFPSFGNRP